MLESCRRRLARLQRLLSNLSKLAGLQGRFRRVQGAVRSSGRHPQPPFLHPEPINQCFIPGAGTAAGFELEFPLAAGWPSFSDRAQAHSQALTISSCLPTGQPP